MRADKIHRRAAEDAERAQRENLRFIEIEDFATDALFEQRHVKVDEQSNFPAAETKISYQLGLMDRSERFNRLYFYDYRARY